MTANELIKKFNDEFRLNPWPKIYEVDAETYGNCIQAIIENKFGIGDYYKLGNYELGLYKEFRIQCGPNNGIYFRNVELIKK